MTTPTPLVSVQADVRRSLCALLESVVADPSTAFGYRFGGITFGKRIEVTVEKQGATFVLWLEDAREDAPCFSKTAHFRIGYRGNLPDRLGGSLLAAVHTRLMAWEETLPADASRQGLWTPSPPPASPGGSFDATLDPDTATLLLETPFSPIYEDWLEPRDRQLLAGFEKLKIDRAREILLVNATKGVPFYASIADFFVHLQRVHPRLRATGASYFGEIADFHEAVARKGLSVVAIEDLMGWDAAQFNRFDAIVLIGPSDLLLRLMKLTGVRARLILLDLGFYHQVLDANPSWYPGAPPGADQTALRNLASQTNRITIYSCQPEAKIRRDLSGFCALGLLEWRWFNYIPIGFRYRSYFRTERRAFDVALLGTDGRDYSQIDPVLFRGLRFLFLGAVDKAPAIRELQQHVSVTVVSRIDEDSYTRLLAMCRCVVLPHPGTYVENVLLSVIDTVASGKALVTPHHPGIARLRHDGLPGLFYDTTPADLFRQVSALVGDEIRLRDIEDRSIALAKGKLDIYRVLGSILEEQILTTGSRLTWS